MTRRNNEALKQLEKLISEPVTFGLYLKSIRESEGLTQSDFVEKFGISVPHLATSRMAGRTLGIERAELQD